MKQLLGSEAKDTSYHLLAVSNAAATCGMRTTSPGGIPLLDLLRGSRGRSATKNVDRVYATSGLPTEVQWLADGRFDTLLEPGYMRPLAAVYRDVAKYLIVEHRNLHILSHAGGSQAAEDPI